MAFKVNTAPEISTAPTTAIWSALLPPISTFKIPPLLISTSPLTVRLPEVPSVAAISVPPLLTVTPFTLPTPPSVAPLATVTPLVLLSAPSTNKVPSPTVVLPS